MPTKLPISPFAPRNPRNLTPAVAPMPLTTPILGAGPGGPLPAPSPWTIGNGFIQYAGGGVQVGTPTGGNKGAGSINAASIYLNGTALTPGGTGLPLTGGTITGNLINQRSTADAVGPWFVNQKSRGVTAAPALVQKGDSLGRWSWQTYNSSTFVDAAYLQAVMLDTASSGALGTGVNLFANPALSATPAQVAWWNNPNPLAGVLPTNTAFIHGVAGGGFAAVDNVVAPNGFAALVAQNGLWGLLARSYANPGQITQQQARGAYGTPGAVLAGDLLGSWAVQGYDGAAFRTGVQLKVNMLAASPGASSFASQLEIDVVPAGSGATVPAVTIDGTGLNVIVGGVAITSPTGSFSVYGQTGGTSNLNVYWYDATPTTGGALKLVRGRGTQGSPAAVQKGDVLGYQWWGGMVSASVEVDTASFYAAVTETGTIGAGALGTGVYLQTAPIGSAAPALTAWWGDPNALPGAVTIAPSGVIGGFVSADSITTPAYITKIISNGAAGSRVAMRQYNGSIATSSGQVVWETYRGTALAPANLQKGDQAGALSWAPYVGGALVTTAQLMATLSDASKGTTLTLSTTLVGGGGPTAQAWWGAPDPAALIYTTAVTTSIAAGIVGIQNVLAADGLSGFIRSDAGSGILTSSHIIGTGGTGGVVQAAGYRGTFASPQIVQSGDVLGQLRFSGFDGTSLRTGAQITGLIQESSPTTAHFGTRLGFWTVANGGANVGLTAWLNDIGVVSAVPGITTNWSYAHGALGGWTVTDANPVSNRMASLTAGGGTSGTSLQLRDAGGSGAFIAAYSCRGTLPVPTVLNSSDTSFSFNGYAYNGSTYINHASIRIQVIDGNPTASMRTQFAFLGCATGGNTLLNLFAFSDTQVILSQGQNLVSTVSAGSGAAAAIAQVSETTCANTNTVISATAGQSGQMNFRRARGAQASLAQVNNADTVAQITFSPYSGSAYLSAMYFAASINDAGVGPTSMGTRLRLYCTPAGSITAAVAMQVDFGNGIRNGTNSLSVDPVFGGMTAQNATFLLNKTGSGQNCAVNAQSNNLLRWNLVLGDATAEGGSNAGSNFSLAAYADTANTLLGTPISCVRATQVVTFSQAIVNGSDERWKENVATIADATGNLKQMRGVTYTVKNSPPAPQGRTIRERVGLIAQEVQSVLPHVVESVHEQTLYGETYLNALGISYTDLVGVLVQGFRELEHRVAWMESHWDEKNPLPPLPPLPDPVRSQ
jgi:hypothetical protein